MQNLSKALSSLLSDVSSDQRFADPKRRSKIQSEADQVAHLAHELGRDGVVSPDHDPSVLLFSSIFAGESHYAAGLLKTGHDVYARELLRGVPGYCIACHTRNPHGPSFTGFEPAPTGLTPLERGEFFAASRQYDRALDTLNPLLSEPGAPAIRPLEWTRAMKDSLAIAVRVKQDPDLAGGIVDRIIAAKDAPLSIKEDALQWRQTIQAWRNEPRREPLTEDGWHSEAVRLLAQAHDLQKYPTDRSADILYLRATVAIHELLAKAPLGPHAAEAYLMAGIAYEVLRAFHLDEIHEVYYEACIRAAPHTPVATSCYHRYEASVYEGYTGSGGVHLPDDLRESLRKLRELADPAAAPGEAVAHEAR